MLYLRLIGALFLAAFAFYEVGFGLVTSVVGARGFLLTISATDGMAVVRDAHIRKGVSLSRRQ